MMNRGILPIAHLINSADRPQSTVINCIELMPGQNHHLPMLIVKQVIWFKIAQNSPEITYSLDNQGGHS
jgi:hypothetical protein